MSIHAANFRELRLDRLCRDFGTHNAVKDVTLTIKQGEFIALLGPSGCGKSTTLNLIAGLLPATGGGIWLDEKRIDPLRPEERGFGMVFQSYALFPHMSVKKNIGFGLKMRGMAKAESDRRVAEAVGLVRLQGQEEKLPGQLSGGQQQRVAIARAIAVQPPLVLMDEPLSNLDAKLRLEMRAEIRRIHNTLGATTIYVTHDQEEALSLADRIVVMRDGQIRQVGGPGGPVLAAGPSRRRRVHGLPQQGRRPRRLRRGRSGDGHCRPGRRRRAGAFAGRGGAGRAYLDPP
jgi:putative spermidine/putrescine transport system ATP-binding protein